MTHIDVYRAGTKSNHTYTLFFNRLNVFNGANGRQPFRVKALDGDVFYSAINGEIYNHKHLDERITDVFRPYLDATVEADETSLFEDGAIHRAGGQLDKCPTD